ncbi:MAG TPA: efflux RND transporter periplasmic adaptor subunit [Terriglobales bacterium]|jgi:RND family efflux transporter MFP subunit|nr:efflux RND transporter periplasmic adaptor subunit [Terriglobales bacterium]
MNLLTTTRLSFAAAVVLLCSAVGCSHSSGQGTSEDAVATVTVAKVTRSDITRILAVTGTIAALPNEDAKVSSPVPGRIAKILVAEGDHVSAGQVMAQIDPQTLRDQVRQAEGAVEQARANLQNAIANRDRNENLFQRGIAAGKEVEDARTQVMVNQGALNQAEAALSIARQQLGRAEIRSPFDATVVKRFANVGEQVDGTAAQPIIEVANVKTVELLGNVPAVYLAKVRVGLKFNVTSDSVPGATFNGNVAAVSPAVDPTSDVGLVRIRIANPQGLLRLGMFLTAQLPLETHSNALVVPSKAIYRGEDSKPQVYRVEVDKAEAKAAIAAVTLGIETSDQTELLDGVKEGDTVVLEGGYGLPDGAKVKVKQ